jgi:hypothetical protein
VGVNSRRRAVGIAALAAAATLATVADASASSYRSITAQAARPATPAAEASAAASLSLRSSRRFVILGRRHALAGRLTRNGRGLRGRLVRLQADPYPFGNGFRTLAATRTGRGGGFGFVGPPKRNTRFRAVAPGAGVRSRRVLVYVDYWGRERHSYRRGRLRMGFLIFAPFGAPGPGRQKIHFYLTQNGQTTMPRVASTRMRRIGRGYMRGRAVVRSRRPARGERVWVCWREEPSDGFGLPSPLDPVCGDDVVTTPPPP